LRALPDALEQLHVAARHKLQRAARAMPRGRRSTHSAAIGRREALVAQADAERGQRRLRAQQLAGGAKVAAVLRRAGPGREDEQLDVRRQMRGEEGRRQQRMRVRQHEHVRGERGAVGAVELEGTQQQRQQVERVRVVVVDDEHARLRRLRRERHGAAAAASAAVAAHGSAARRSRGCCEA
jgi:hypothetical protein